MIVGFDVGGTNARGLLFDPASRSVVDRSRASSAGPGPVVLATLVALVREFESRNNITVDAVGLGIAGLANRSGVVRYSPNLPELVEYPLGTELAATLGIPVTVANDATTGAWAEAELGAGRGTDDFLFVALGTGIGTGFVVGGQLLLGANGFAGESGHMVVEANGPAHITGQRGPWEYFASGSALGRLGREAATAGRFDAAIELAGDISSITGFHVANALAAGDEEAALIFDEFCREVARGCANLVVIFDPQRVVIGGGLTGIGEPLRQGVEDWLEELLLGSDHRPRVEVRLAELGDEAGALGAALIAIDDL
jgi:glucokinase